MFHTANMSNISREVLHKSEWQKNWSYSDSVHIHCSFTSLKWSRNLLVHNAFPVTKDFCHQVKSLKNKKGKTILNGFIEIVNKSKHKQSKFWVDQGRELFSNLCQKC